MTKEKKLYDKLLKQLEIDKEPELHVVILKEKSIFLFYITYYIANKILLRPVINLKALIELPWLYNKTPISYKRKEMILKIIKEYEKQ
mgnify:FL=1